MCRPVDSRIDADAERVRQGAYVIYRAPDVPMAVAWTNKMAPNVRLRVTRDLASAVSFCAHAGVKLVVHPSLIRISQRGVVCHVGDAPDTRFDPPEREYSPAWSIGCVLHKMITGSAPVTTRDLAAHREMRAIVRCLGTPTLSESHALGIPIQATERARAKVPGASLAERILLRATIAWDPARRMACAGGGLVSSLDTVQGDGPDGPTPPQTPPPKSKKNALPRPARFSRVEHRARSKVKGAAQKKTPKTPPFYARARFTT